MKNKKQESDKEKKGHDVVEKVTFAFGILVLVSLVAFLVYHMNKDTNKPAELIITVSEQPEMQEYTFRVEIENVGDQTAEAAQIKLNLYQKGEITNDGVIQVQYVPMKSKETAWIVFHKDKMPGDSLVVSSVTYVKP